MGPSESSLRRHRVRHRLRLPHPRLHRGRPRLLRRNQRRRPNLGTPLLLQPRRRRRNHLPLPSRQLQRRRGLGPRQAHPHAPHQRRRQELGTHPPLAQTSRRTHGNPRHRTQLRRDDHFQRCRLRHRERREELAGAGEGDDRRHSQPHFFLGSVRSVVLYGKYRQRTEGQQGSLHCHLLSRKLLLDLGTRAGLLDPPQSRHTASYSEHGVCPRGY
mmetsp:Transcript_24882/g.52141  ORF Transcript_24882/g.52141 Transcript_24882/m.52141 type:complete len:215 (+) Transcript_24882:384-1028(+)